MHKINLGSKAFVKNKSGFIDYACQWRICQDSITTLFPCYSKRKVKISMKDFKYFLEKKNLKYEEILNEDLKKELEETGSGSVVLYIEEKSEDGTPLQRDYLVCNNFRKSIQIMCSTELYESFKLRYF